MVRHHCAHVSPHEMSAVLQDLLDGWVHAVEEGSSLLTVIHPKILWALYSA